MQFDSFTFLVFFSLVLGWYGALKSWDKKKNLLLIASYVFYSAWSPWFLPLLIISSSLDWWMSLRMSKSETKTRKLWVIAIITINISILAYFKYAIFFAENANHALSWFGLNAEIPKYSLILPLGISFYTFHSLSYCIDVYRRRFEPSSNLRDYLLYVAFFPQLVAGPIVRWTQMCKQIELPRTLSLRGVAVGGAMMIFGLFEKIVLADTIFAPVANNIFALSEPTTIQAWVGVIAFSGQIFCDFAGYSTCAIGAAFALGFNLPINFKNPYVAAGFSDFWTKWHVSLSTWLRDYLYIPLGGNRRSIFFTCRNLMLTMLIGGLWHGAGWTFIIWGGLHGVYLILERLLREHFPRPYYLPRWLISVFVGSYTLIAVMYAWVWFRVSDVAHGWSLTKILFTPAGEWQGLTSLVGEQKLVIVTFIMLLGTQLLYRERELKSIITEAPVLPLGVVLGGCTSLIILAPGAGNIFIYFQF